MQGKTVPLFFLTRFFDARARVSAAILFTDINDYLALNDNRYPTTSLSLARKHKAVVLFTNPPPEKETHHGSHLPRREGDRDSASLAPRYSL